MKQFSTTDNLPINELYTCIQGEGLYSGVPHILIRFVGCKLRCCFKDSFCDTSFNSWKPEKGSVTFEEIVSLFNKNPQINHVLITGGGPTIHGQLLIDFIDTLRQAIDRKLVICLETEGSEFVAGDYDLVTISPKLKNSTPVLGKINPYTDQQVAQSHINQHEKWRTNYSAMLDFIQHQDSRNRLVNLKFVVSLREDLQEIEQIITLLQIDAEDVFLMPEGVTENGLQEKRQMIFELCIENGFRYTDRLHIIAFGDKRLT